MVEGASLMLKDRRACESLELMLKTVTKKSARPITACFKESVVKMKEKRKHGYYQRFCSEVVVLVKPLDLVKDVHEDGSHCVSIENG